MEFTVIMTADYLHLATCMFCAASQYLAIVCFVLLRLLGFRLSWAFLSNCSKTMHLHIKFLDVTSWRHSDNLHLSLIHLSLIQLWLEHGFLIILSKYPLSIFN